MHFFEPGKFLLKGIGLHLLLFFAAVANGQTSFTVNAPNSAAPVLPGWFADPTIKKFGDLYYIYATTDNIMLASGAPTVWYSKDLKHWYNYIMQVPPFTKKAIRNFWAPDIIQGRDKRFYLYFGNCEMGCNIYGYVSGSATGPWTKLSSSDQPVIPEGSPRKSFPSLDAQFFEDTDGRIYAYWGTWVHYNGGYAAGELDTKTMAAVKDGLTIPLKQTPNPFEAPYMMKKGNKYILMYSGGSCHNETYEVRYAYADHPYGPFTPGKNNPVLSTTGDGSTHGPGHHSVLKMDTDDYYIMYHKHDHPFTAGGLSRQVCMDRLLFENDSTLLPVVPGSSGGQPVLATDVPQNMAFHKKTTASSYYQLRSSSIQYDYTPAFATDENNATLWKAASNHLPQSLVIDLGQTTPVARVTTAFEYATYYYQYKLEYSLGGNNWLLYADRSENRIPGSPMIDDNSVTARYLRLTVLHTQKTGHYAAVWDMRVYSSKFALPLALHNRPEKETPAKISAPSLLINAGAAGNTSTKKLSTVKNTGSVGGVFYAEGKVELIKDEQGISAWKFYKGALVLNRPVPEMLGWNSSFTVAAWVKNPEVDNKDECLFSWCDRTDTYLANSYAALFYNSAGYGAAAHMEGHFDMGWKQLPEASRWHFIVLSFDGVSEKVYVDGKLNNAQNMALCASVKNARFRIGASDAGEYFTGWMGGVQMYNYALDEAAIKQLMQQNAVLFFSNYNMSLRAR